jgi:hypothetical protein
VAADRRRSIRESCRKETAAQHRARQRTTIAAYFRRKDPRNRKRKRGDAFDDAECIPETTSGGSESFVDANVPGSAEKNAIHILSSDSFGGEGSFQSATGASTSTAGSPSLHSAPRAALASTRTLTSRGTTSLPTTLPTATPTRKRSLQSPLPRARRRTTTR